MARAEYHLRLQKEVIIMIVLLFLLQWWSSHGCVEEERAALLQLQHSFNIYPNATSLPYYWDMHIDCCEWYGVECNVTTRRVYELYLWHYRDESLGEWKFNASVFLPFQQLRSLNLRGNNIVCCVENEGFERLQRLNNLEALRLDDNGLTNNVLPMFYGFQSLKTLSLGHNKLSGSIYTKDLFNMTNLEELDLSDNNIEKFISSKGFEGLQRLNNLEALYLDENGLTNNVFPMFYGFVSLKTLSLRYNKLSGSIYTKDLFNMTNLEELDLSDNNIEKFISSKDIQSLSNIGILWLSDGVCNGDSFELQSLKAFKNLKSIHLEYNNFKGVLFPQGLNKLEELFLDDSDMDENFLLSLGALQSLRLFSSQRIQFETPINIHSFPNFKNLKLLDLSENNVSNSILNSIANATSLESLKMSSCKLTGNIDELCKLKNLKELHLEDNNINGTLPSCLANLTLLQHLDLSFNHFTENISTSPLKSHTSIEYLSIYYNHFQIPISLSPFLNHSKLKVFIASGNEVYAESGGVDNNLTPKLQLEKLALSSTYGEGGVSFPRFLHHQNDLRVLDLSGIQMRRVGFPTWLLDNNTNLDQLYLSNCSLWGTLHLPIHPRAQLIDLDISNNLLYGHIPTEIGRYFPNLYTLSLSENDFIGKISDSLSNCSLLQNLDLSYNNLSGKIPKWIGNMSSLKVLDMSNNNLFGSLPSIFIPLQASHIHLSHNRLEGPFPGVLPNSTVFILDLSHNYLTGSIPNSIKNLRGLMYVLLNHNNLEGEIPFYLWKMMHELKFVDLSHNRFDSLSLKNDPFEVPSGSGILDYDNEFLELAEKGNIYQYGTSRMNDIGFIGLDLSTNNLTCSIPIEIGNKEGMKMLNLSHNNLIGHIPLSFSNMTAVESLDLSYNNLNGTFPPKLVQLKFLEVFSVAYNNISGKTPERVGQFATFEERSYRGNLFLCGLPLPKNCTLRESLMTKESSTSDTDDDNGFIDMEVFQISFWVSFTIILMGITSVLSINPYWRQVSFYFIELMIMSCYYFLVDHLPFLSKFGITYLL